MGRGIRIYPTNLMRVKNVLEEGEYTAPRCPYCNGGLIPKIVPAPFTKEFQNLKFWCSSCIKWRQPQDVLSLVAFLKELGILTWNSLNLDSSGIKAMVTYIWVPRYSDTHMKRTRIHVYEMMEDEAEKKRD